MIQVDKQDEKRTIKVLRPFWLIDTDGNKPVREKAAEGKEYTLDAAFCAEMVNCKKAEYVEKGKQSVEAKAK